MAQLKIKVGEIYVFKDNHTMEIIEYFGAKNITVKFNDGIVFKNATYDNFKKGGIKNRNNPNVEGVGYIGYGNYNEKNNKLIYNTWRGMLERCYNENMLQKRSSYKGCVVHKDWHNFQNFAKWFEENYVEGFKIDKDILIKGNKIYSAETCCFVPVQINGLFVLCTKKRGKYPLSVRITEYGKFVSNCSVDNKRIYLGTYDTYLEAFNVYKVHKENRIKELAEKYKVQISEQCYNSLINWKIEIND